MLETKLKDFNNLKNIATKLMFALKDIRLVKAMARLSSSGSATFVNRNPRNLERMRIGRKPDGYHLDKPGRKFWHKLVVNPTNRIVTAQVVHFMNGPVIEAKTSEWALRKQLYSMVDTSAYMNLGRVLAQRCLECGILEMCCDLKPQEGSKIEKFLKEFENGGIRLQELDVYKNPQPWDKFRPEKPWDVTEE